MRKMKLFILMFFIASFTCACNKEETVSGTQGYALFSLDADEAVSTRAAAGAQDRNLNLDDFTFQILNASQQKVKEWSYSQIKGQRVPLPQGRYVAKAFYGDSTQTGFGVLFFEGHTPFEVVSGPAVPVSVLCRQENVEIAVKWGENIKKDYQDYSLKVYRKGKTGELVFGKDEVRSGFIPEGEISMEVRLRDLSGTERLYAPDPIRCTGNDRITLTIDTKARQPEGETGVDITFRVDSATEDRNQELDIPAYMVPSQAPVFQLEGFDAATRTASYYMGDVPAPVRVVAKAPGYMAACTMTVDSEVITGLNSNAVDLVHPDPADRTRLKDVYGIVWDAEMENSIFATVDFTGFVKNMEVSGQGAKVLLGTFTFNATDRRGNASEVLPVVLERKLVPFAVQAIQPADMWSGKAYLNLETDVEDNSLFRFYAPETGTDYQAAMVSEAGGVKTFEITGLEPGREYTFAVDYTAGGSGVQTQTLKGTTEPAQQLENGNMEDWTTATHKTYGNQDLYEQDPALQGSKMWGTRNRQTMDGISGGSATSTQNQTTAYHWNCCTIPTTDAAEGSRAAEIRTMALATVNIKGTDFFFNKGKMQDIVRNNHKVYAGYLFTGTEDVTNAAPVPDPKGVAFASRPASMAFQYKYAPFKNGSCRIYAVLYSGDEQIAATDVFESNAAVAQYQKKVLPFHYTVRDRQATSLFIMFQSGTEATETWDNVQVVEGSYTMTPWSLDTWVGSVLKVDNIRLNY